MFTRNELIMISFMIAFALIGSAINLIKGGNKDIEVKVIEKSFPVKDVSVINVKKKININKADVGEIMQINGIGEKIAERIIEYRKSKGGFKKDSDLLNIKGIGKKKLEKMINFIEI